MLKPLFRCLLAAVLVTNAAPLHAQSLTTELLASGFNNPIGLRQPAGEQRIFILSEVNGVHVIDNGVVQPTLYLDLTSVVQGAAERVLGFEFHPDYVNNGRMWVSYMDPTNTTHVVEYQRDANNPNRADVASAVHLFGPTQQPANIHNWYDMHFGPDGMLYLGFGDGGGANDPNEHAQDLTVTYGKILRIDVDTGIPGTYTVPPGNPFVGTPGAAPEIWHYGVRSPWRFSFDSMTGDFWLGDVGQAAWEEIDFAPAGVSGVNFGWRCREGEHCTGLSNCVGCPSALAIDPVVEYPHLEGRCAVVGGYVYRGSAIPWLDGTYFYGDFCSGRIWSLEYDGTTVSNFVERSAELDPENGVIRLVTSFGEDASGELYVLDRAGGEIWKIVEADCDVPTYCTAGANSVGSGAIISSGGCPRVAQNEFELKCSGLPANQFGLFFYGNQQASAPFGQGTLCVGGTNGLHRLKPPVLSSGTGTVERDLDLTAPPTDVGPGKILAGSTWYFQFWYRDPSMGFNLSNALAVTFEP